MSEAILQRLAALADRYHAEGEIGHGGMATVFRARDLKHDRLVAIKVLRPDLAQALGGDRFLREIRIAAQLQSPHILPLLDSGQVGRAPLLRHAAACRASRCGTSSRARASCRRPRRCGSCARSWTGSPTPIGTGWCIATSSPTT